jgi:hypothetical protein
MPYPLRLVLTIGAVVAALVIAAKMDVVGNDNAQQTAARPAAQVPIPSPTAQPAADGIPSGTWIIGVDMQPGTYRSGGAEHGIFEFCSWSTKSGPSTNSTTLDFGTANADEPMIVEITSKVKAFTTNNCEPWTKVS